ncbi:hypothetical protein [Vibrio sp. MACH09]|uniref:hypothetical protein n=1 Tax=Vibrio sp. MACH09 TaxID=3025122 RepID=UPI00295E76D4|nr:hypothetical protein [Vibrio sp. MACH09]
MNRDTTIKQGQIAHLDHDASNNDESNLAFLCFDHHDQYDSTTRQSKNLTKLEVLEFRNELITDISNAFSGLVAFGEASTLGTDVISGHYVRDGEFESADVKVQRLPDGKYHVDGLALWGKTREYGPNIGDLDFIGELHDDTIEYTSGNPAREPYKALFQFHNGTLVISEENWCGIFGMNVCFQGQYHKAT